MKMMVSLLFFFLISCFNQKDTQKIPEIKDAEMKTAASYVWTKLLDSADWKKSYNFQMFSNRDTLWTFHPDGNWFSTNGINWIKSKLPNPIYNLAFLDYIQFKDAIYGLGHFEGNIENSDSSR
jgi:hypothetical protein